MMKASFLICGFFLALAPVSPALAQPSEERPIKRLRLEGRAEKAEAEALLLPYGRHQVIHEQRTAMPFDCWTTGLTEEGQLVGLAPDGSILFLDLATGALEKIRPEATPGLEFLSDLMGRDPRKVVVLQHRTGELTPGTLLALTLDGICRVNVRDRTVGWVAGLDSIPPDEGWRRLALAEGCDGSIQVSSESSGKVWQVHAGAGRLEPLLEAPGSTWAPLSFEPGVRDAERRRALPPGVGMPSARLSLGRDLFMGEPGGTLVESRGLWRFDPTSGVRTWPLPVQVEAAFPPEWRLIAVLPDGSWVFWGAEGAMNAEDGRDMLYMVSPADELQTRLEALVRQGGRAAEAGDHLAWARVFSHFDALGLEGAAAEITSAITSSRPGAPFQLHPGRLIANYAQAPAPYATRLRIRLARAQLVAWAKETGQGWDDPVTPEMPPEGPSPRAWMDEKAPMPAPPPFGRLNPLPIGCNDLPDGLTSEGLLMEVDRMTATVSFIDLAKGVRGVLSPGTSAETAGWPPLEMSAHLFPLRGGYGFKEGTLLLVGPSGLHHLDPRKAILTPLVPASHLPVAPGSLFLGQRLHEDWDGTIHLSNWGASRVWRLEVREGAWGFREVVDIRRGDPGACLARRHPGAWLAKALKAFPTTSEEPYLDLDGPESLPPDAWAASIPIRTARIWADIDGPRVMCEDFLTEPGGTLAEVHARYRIDPAGGTETRPLNAAPFMALAGERRLVAVLPDGSWLCAKPAKAHAPEGQNYTLHLFSPADGLQAELERLVDRGTRAALERNPADMGEVLHDLDVLRGVQSPMGLVFRSISAAHREGYFPPVLAQVIADYLEVHWSTKLRARLARQHLDAWAGDAGIPLNVSDGAPARLMAPTHPAR